MRRWISLPRVEGAASRQAHADLPQGTYERELGKEGFYGPSTQMYHSHPPTAWRSFEGPLRPRALDTARPPPPRPLGHREAPRQRRLTLGRDAAHGEPSSCASLLADRALDGPSRSQ